MKLVNLTPIELAAIVVIALSIGAGAVIAGEVVGRWMMIQAMLSCDA